MKARVLVVEDSQVQREQLVASLRQRGYDVHQAVNGLEALRLIKTEPFDVVILDIVLEGMDGYSVCRWLRLGESTRDIVVIMLTVRGEVKERVEGLHVGADDYLPKPYDEDELEARIFAALRTRTARLELRERNAELEGLLKKTEHMAMTDALTGVFNRRRFHDVLRREWATAKRYGHPLTVILVDIDHFKVVNDEHGHARGDEVLQKVADVMASSVREVDVCARTGGDEFGLVLPHTAAVKAMVVAERIQTRLALAVQTLQGEARNVTLSVGIASSEDASLKNPDHLVEAADQALFAAKRQGRNRVLLATPGLLARD